MLGSCRQASTDVDIGVKVSDSLRQSVAGKLDADADGGGRSKACLNNREKKRRKSRLLLKLPRRSWIVTRVSFFTYTHFYDFMNARRNLVAVGLNFFGLRDLRWNLF